MTTSRSCLAARRSRPCSWRPSRLIAHHEILAKFDDHKPVTLNGVVTLVDWRNPHVHVFMNVTDAERGRQLGDRARKPDRPAAERLDRAKRCSPATRFASTASPPETAATRRGATRSSMRATGKACLNVTLAPPAAAARDRGRRRDGPIASRGWARPAADRTGLLGVSERHGAREGNSAADRRSPMDTWGLLRNIADAPKVAPMQPWALALYTERQTPVPAGRPDVPELQTAGRTASVPAGATASSSSRTAIGSGSSC